MTTATQDTSQDGQPTGEPRRDVADAQKVPHRVLFLCATEPDVASGTPVILCDLLAHFPPGDAELICEKKYQAVRRRQIALRQPVRMIRFPQCLWPFRRGSRLRKVLAGVGLPWLVMVGWWRVVRFRPTCIVAIYWQATWILAAYLIARLGRVPLVYYVHDTLSENFHGGGRLREHFVTWLERTVLRGARTMVLHPYLADHYRERYGIECTVLRQIVRHEPLPPRRRETGRPALKIGFAGAIYDNNARQLAELAAIVRGEPRLRLKMWSDATMERLTQLGIAGERIDAGFEANYEWLLECLSGCDLLYLPLAFTDSEALTTDALQFAFPTKSLDYLVVGTPILVHCPENFELSRFFRQHGCGHVLNDGQPAALAKWLEAWLAGGMKPPDDVARHEALQLFSAQENRRVLWQTIWEETAAEQNRTTKPSRGK